MFKENKMSKDRQAKRKERIKQEKNKKEIIDKFPDIIFFCQENAPCDLFLNFKKIYKNLIAELNFKKEKTNNEQCVFEFLKAIRKHNLNFSIDSYFAKKIMNSVLFQSNYKHFKEKFNYPVKHFLIAMSQLVLSCLTSLLIKKTSFEKYFPDYFFTVGYFSNQIYIKFHKVKTQKTSNGTIYEHFKKINVEEKQYEIHFSKHAIERITERIFSASKVNTSEFSFFDTTHENIVMDTFAEFIAHANFEFCGFSKNQHLLCCYMPLTYEVSKKIETDNKILNKSDFPLLKNQKYQRILMKYFYFPFIVEGNKIICKSALLAGFSGTPEFTLRNLILNNGFDFDVNCKKEEIDYFLEILKNFYSKQKNNSFVFTDDFYIICMFFHMLGKYQFFKGEWISFPHFTEISKEVLAI
jgi:hypothetical protein